MSHLLAIETGIEPEYEQALIEAARCAGWEVHSVQNIPFTDQFITGDPHMGSPLPDELLQNPNVWFHGSIQAAKRAQSVTQWQVHAPWDDLRCSVYYLKLQDRILQQNARIWALGELPGLKDDLYATLGVEGHLFFRPDGNDKVFNGGVTHRQDFDEAYKLMGFYDPPMSTKVVVAPARNIQAEARFLIVDGKLVTGSYYKTGGQSVQLGASDSLLEIAEDHLQFCLAQGYDPAPSWVLDLAQTAEGWRIIEVGATSCCGLYKCDLEAFVEALEQVL